MPFGFETNVRIVFKHLSGHMACDAHNGLVASLRLSKLRSGGTWEYDPYHSSIITAGNGGTKPTQAAFTIFYNQGSQRYDLEQTLQPDQQMWIDIGKLIREHVPDKSGKILPENLTSGSYQFRDLTNKGVGALFEGKVIYDKTYGHVTYGCATCCGYSDAPYMYYNPIEAFIGAASDQDVWDLDFCSEEKSSVLFAILSPVFHPLGESARGPGRNDTVP
jgi:hypothetical protein